VGNKLKKVSLFNMGELWRSFRDADISFKALCLYFIFEYFRPQAIIAEIDIIPWPKTCLIVATVFAIIGSRLTFRKLPLVGLLVLFQFAILISLVNAEWIDWSVEHLLDYTRWLIIIFLTANLVDSKDKFKIIFFIILAASFKLSLFGAMAWVGRGFAFTAWGIKGPPGYFENSGEYAIQMLIMFPLAYYFFVSNFSRAVKIDKVILSLLVVTPVFAIIAAGSRGAQIALALQFIFLYWNKIFKLKFVVIGLVLSLLVASLFPAKMVSRFEQIGYDKPSLQRILYLENGLEIIKDNPTFGVGFYNFIPYYNRHYPEGILYKSAQLPHNIFLQVGTELGLFGLGIFLIIITKSIMLCRTLSRGQAKTYPEISKGIGLGIIGFVMAGQFVSVVYYPFLWINIALAISLASINSKEIL